MIVNRFSYSALMTFLRNQTDFQKKYIAGVWDDPKTPALVIGHAFHTALETKFKGGSLDEAVNAGLKEIEITSDYEIDYGKTGSRQKMIETFTQLFTSYFNECPSFSDIVDVEVSIERKIAGVPFKGIIDLVYRENGVLWLRDHKTVSSYTSEDEENYKYLLQGYFYLVLAEENYGEKVGGIVFDEIKKSLNRDGSPQSHQVIYPRNALLGFKDVAEKILTRAFDYVNSPSAIFFPNPSDLINGQESMRVVSNLEEGFDKARVKSTRVSAPKFAPVNITADISSDDGTDEEKVMRKLAEFGVGGVLGETVEGYQIKLIKFKPNRGVSMSKVSGLANDIALELGATSVRIQAPIRGTNLVGIEIPTKTRKVAEWRDEYYGAPNTLEIPLGFNVSGELVRYDLRSMPHLLVAGQTGSGKSVVLNVAISSILHQMPNLDLYLIDPKEVEFADYAGRAKKLATSLEESEELIDGLVEEMDLRYKELRKSGCKKIEEYNLKNNNKMHYAVLVCDEFADLMLSGGQKKRKVLDEDGETLEFPSIEQQIIRLAQKGRACGIHLIIATQRPSADVCTGLIKANFPSKVALAVANGTNSRIIIDELGAEELLGRGDMLFVGCGDNKPVRLQGLYL